MNASSAESWISWIDAAKLVATGLVAVGVAIEFGGEWVEKPFKKIVEDARKEELARLSVAAKDAEAKMAAAIKDAEIAKAEQERLKSIVNWRVISPEKLNILANSLSKSNGSVTLRYVATDAEAISLAVQFSKAFERANQIAGRNAWKIIADPHLFLNRLVFLTHIPDLHNDASDAIQRAFSEAEIDYLRDDVVEQSNVAAGIAGMSIGPMQLKSEALIIVGSKPPPF